MRFGVLLPHFGSKISGGGLAQFATTADSYGFDSLWVRDHVVYDPRGFEADEGRTFVEAFATLAFVAAVTRRVELGTAAVIPSRHPLLLAQQVAALSFLSQRRVLLGLGAGHSDAEFAAVGRPSTLVERVDRDLPEIIDTIRAAWRGSVDGMDFEPKPPFQPAVWYCGTTPKALRIARERCGGWAPGRITVQTLRDRLPDDLPPGFRVAVSPLVVMTEPGTATLAEKDVDKLLDHARNHRWISKPPGGFQTLDDAEGLILAGTAESFVSTIRAYREVGVTDVIFDLRLQPLSRLRVLAELADSLHLYRRAAS